MHLVAAVGGLGQPFLGARVATALLARRRGGLTASATVSNVMVGGSEVGMAASVPTSEWGVGRSGSSLVTVSATGEAGGLVRKSRTNSNTSSIFRGGRLENSSLIRSTAHSSSGDSVPDSDGERVVQSNSSVCGGSCCLAR